VYAGEIFRLPASDASHALIGAVRQVLVEIFGSAELRDTHLRLDGAELLSRLGRARRVLRSEPRFVALAWSLARDAGVSPDPHRLDVPRLRAVIPGAHLDPRAAPAYFAHRDTWYGSPRTQLNWWTPLHDIDEQSSFAFYPEAFGTPIANSSLELDYPDFARRAGWQNPHRDPAVVYPSAQPLSPPRTFRCAAGEVMVFSGAHLHATRPNLTDLIRLSVDFRLVHERDQAAGVGAPDQDNQSRGSALCEYHAVGDPS
jgi:hypothetical protein